MASLSVKVTFRDATRRFAISTSGLSFADVYAQTLELFPVLRGVEHVLSVVDANGRRVILDSEDTFQRVAAACGVSLKITAHDLGNDTSLRMVDTAVPAAAFIETYPPPAWAADAPAAPVVPVQAPDQASSSRASEAPSAALAGECQGLEARRDKLADECRSLTAECSRLACESEKQATATRERLEWMEREAARLRERREAEFSARLRSQAQSARLEFAHMKSAAASDAAAVTVLSDEVQRLRLLVAEGEAALRAATEAAAQQAEVHAEQEAHLLATIESLQDQSSRPRETGCPFVATLRATAATQSPAEMQQYLERAIHGLVTNPPRASAAPSLAVSVVVPAPPTASGAVSPRPLVPRVNVPSIAAAIERPLVESVASVQTVEAASESSEYAAAVAVADAWDAAEAAAAVDAVAVAAPAAPAAAAPAPAGLLSYFWTTPSTAPTAK